MSPACTCVWFCTVLKTKLLRLRLLLLFLLAIMASDREVITPSATLLTQAGFPPSLVLDPPAFYGQIGQVEPVLGKSKSLNDYVASFIFSDVFFHPNSPCWSAGLPPAFGLSMPRRQSVPTSD